MATPGDSTSTHTREPCAQACHSCKTIYAGTSSDKKCYKPRCSGDLMPVSTLGDVTRLLRVSDYRNGFRADRRSTSRSFSSTQDRKNGNRGARGNSARGNSARGNSARDHSFSERSLSTRQQWISKEEDFFTLKYCHLCHSTTHWTSADCGQAIAMAKKSYSFIAMKQLHLKRFRNEDSMSFESPETLQDLAARLQWCQDMYLATQYFVIQRDALISLLSLAAQPLLDDDLKDQFARLVALSAYHTSKVMNKFVAAVHDSYNKAFLGAFDYEFATSLSKTRENKENLHKMIEAELSEHLQEDNPVRLTRLSLRFCENLRFDLGVARKLLRDGLLELNQKTKDVLQTYPALRDDEKCAFIMRFPVKLCLGLTPLSDLDWINFFRVPDLEALSEEIVQTFRHKGIDLSQDESDKARPDEEMNYG